MLRASGERGDRVEQRLAAAPRDVGVVFDEPLVVRLVGELTGHQREVMLRGEGLPDRIGRLGPAVAVRAGHQDDDGAQRACGVRDPEAEVRLVEVGAGSDGLLEHTRGRRLRAGVTRA